MVGDRGGATIVVRNVNISPVLSIGYTPTLGSPAHIHTFPNFLRIDVILIVIVFKGG